eukprot:1046541-Rhodomonas_salina.2
MLSVTPAHEAGAEAFTDIEDSQAAAAKDPEEEEEPSRTESGAVAKEALSSRRAKRKMLAPPPDAIQRRGARWVSGLEAGRRLRSWRGFDVFPFPEDGS